MLFKRKLLKKNNYINHMKLILFSFLPVIACLSLSKYLGSTLIAASIGSDPISNFQHMSHHSHPKGIITNQQAFTNSKISTQRNNIYLYGDITPETCEQLKNQLTEMEFNAKLFKISYNSDPPPINLHVQSTGGSLMNALYIVDLIENLDTKVNTYIDGYSASAASLINVVGNKRFMSKNSLVMIHQLYSNNQGKFQELDDDMINLTNLMEKIKTIYLKHTNIKEDVLDEMLKHDLWFDAELSKEYGIIDEIL